MLLLVLEMCLQRWILVWDPHCAVHMTLARIGVVVWWLLLQAFPRRVPIGNSCFCFVSFCVNCCSPFCFVAGASVTESKSLESWLERKTSRLCFEALLPWWRLWRSWPLRWARHKPVAIFFRLSRKKKKKNKKKKKKKKKAQEGIHFILQKGMSIWQLCLRLCNWQEGKFIIMALMRTALTAIARNCFMMCFSR